ncbi:hypothetical protein AAF712_003611 [Marasmius tenuissimus]|uniref:Uncharacterized protein n=1 Tax=Marasmius tenuissimus TaxID=585030 RepID=A0ABR3A7A6_9AGAR
MYAGTAATTAYPAPVVPGPIGQPAPVIDQRYSPLGGVSPLPGQVGLPGANPPMMQTATSVPGQYLGPPGAGMGYPGTAVAQAPIGGYQAGYPNAGGYGYGGAYGQTGGYGGGYGGYGGYGNSLMPHQQPNPNHVIVIDNGRRRHRSHSHGRHHHRHHKHRSRHSRSGSRHSDDLKDELRHVAADVVEGALHSRRGHHGYGPGYDDRYGGMPPSRDYYGHHHHGGMRRTRSYESMY